jgi:ATP-dependent DNA helicase 2 subunit 2
MLQGDENYDNISIFLSLQQSVALKTTDLVNKVRVLMPQIRDLLRKITPSETYSGDGEADQV